MSTILQQNLAREIVKNATRKKPLNKGKLLEIAGYDKTTAEATPTKIIEQKGVKDALREWGLTEELIASSLVDDIRDKPKNRSKELSLGAEILGMKAKENDVVPTVTNFTQIIINPPHGQNPNH
jgi:hypothetical protein